MRIDSKLNLVIPLDRDGGTVFVHATPISRDVFEAHFLVLAKTFSAMHGEGLSIISGPRVAAMLLKKVAVDSGAWEGAGGAQLLMAEIRRLANVLAPSSQGYAMTALEDALRTGAIDPEEASEVENALVFFTLASVMHKRDQREITLGGAGALWGTSITSLGCMEYADSLRTSTATEISESNAA